MSRSNGQSDRFGHHRGDWGATPAPAEFIYADSKYLAHAPPRCPRCQGIWRSVDEGYVCTACGRRWRAGDCLLKMVSRAMAHHDVEMAMRMDNPTPPRGKSG